MTRSFLAICSVAFLIGGCKEVPPFINFNPNNYVDTAYVGSVPASTNAHNVLAEEFTGQSCSNCPAGHAVLDGAASANPGRVNIISMYENGNGVLIPPDTAVYDFRDSAALEIGNSIYNSVNTFPNAGIDRATYTGAVGILLGSADWPGAISNRLSTVDSLNMTVASALSGSVATVTVTLTYTKTVSTQQNISVAVVEDSISDYQEWPFGVDSLYEFNDVFIGMVSTVPFGDPALATVTTKVPGQFLSRVYTYTLPTSFPSNKGTINPAHCRVIAFVNAPGTGGNYQVYQSVQAPLMGQ